MKGEKIAHFELLGKLGEGGMGTVFLAQDLSSKRRVALKTISARWQSDSTILRRFLQEAEVLSKIDHPNIVTVYGFFNHENRWYLAMEYVQGPSLSILVRPADPLPSGIAADIVYKVARGLASAHEYGIIHRDIKPSNILLKGPTSPKITDFGLVRYIRDEIRFPRKSASLLGSPKYMSPEHWTGDGFTSRSDIYSLGIVFFQLLTGTVPFFSRTLDELREETLQCKYLSPYEFHPEVPTSINEIVKRMTRRNPSDRYASADEVMRDLAPFRVRSA